MRSSAIIFKALADETRLRILALLFEGELCVCEIVASLDLPQSTISRHLAYLRKSDWVLDRRQGLWMYYRLNENKDVLIDELRSLLQRHLTKSPEHIKAIESLHSFQKEQNRRAC